MIEPTHSPTTRQHDKSHDNTPTNTIIKIKAALTERHQPNAGNYTTHYYRTHGPHVTKLHHIHIPP